MLVAKIHELVIQNIKEIKYLDIFFYIKFLQDQRVRGMTAEVLLTDLWQIVSQELTTNHMHDLD